MADGWPQPYRVLVTASRDWPSPEVIWHRMEYHRAHAASLGRPLVLVHGDSGAGDVIVKLYGRVTPGVSEEGHPAAWKAPCVETCQPGHRRRGKDGPYCPAAGQYRNAHMVFLHADEGDAFIHRGSAGASGCARMMEEAGIPVRRVDG